jgi:hypothetical protein
MADPTPRVEAFSITHAQICDGLTTFKDQLIAAAAIGLDIYGVNNASLAADTGNYENQGDDQTQSRWNWLNFATVSVQAGYLSFPLYASLSGRPLTTTSTVGPPAVVTGYEIDLWHEDSMNVAPKPLMLVLPSKDENGVVRRLVIGLYKCQFGPIGFDGPAFKDGFKVNYEATALMSLTDEKGLAHADGKAKIGRLLSVI